MSYANEDKYNFAWYIFAHWLHALMLFYNNPWVFYARKKDFGFAYQTTYDDEESLKSDI